MKRFFLFLLPLVIAVAAFFGILTYLDKKSGKGALQVTSAPVSKVYLDEKLIGTTPFCTCDDLQMLSVGDYTIKLVPVEGNFRIFEEKITINKSTLTVVDRTFADSGESDGSIISLIPLSNKNDLEVLVVSLPEKANVFLDNNPIGTTPLLLKNVSESDHDLRVILNGYKDKNIKIKTALGFKLSSLIFLGISTDLVPTPTASPSVSAVLENEAPQILILSTPVGFLRVRENSSINSTQIGQVNPGETYELTDEISGWYQIKFNSPTGEETLGWVSSSYATKEQN